MLTIDANLLLYACNSSSEHHREAKAWLQEGLSKRSKFVQAVQSRNGRTRAQPRVRLQFTKDQVPSPSDWIHPSPGGAEKPAACVDFHARALPYFSCLSAGDLSFAGPCQIFAPPFLGFNQSFRTMNRIRLLIMRGALWRDTIANECTHASDRFQKTDILDEG